MTKYFIYLVAIIFLLSCSNEPAQRDTAGHTLTTSPSAKLREVGTSNENFDNFFKRFETDSIFQKSRIIYPLKYTTIGDEGERDSTVYISKSGSTFWELFTANGSNGIIKKSIVNTKTIQIRFQLQDTGFENDFNFTNKGGKWYLINIVDPSD